MIQGTLDFNLASPREIGKAKAAAHHNPLLLKARDIARTLAGRYGKITIDEVRTELKAQNIEIPYGRKERNWMGSVFDKGFRKVGYKASTHEESHGRIITIWELADARD